LYSRTAPPVPEQVIHQRYGFAERNRRELYLP
jgi:hypothetical protein